MFKAGITGGIGSGKSTVCKVFEVLGIPVYYADYEAKKLIVNNLQIKDSIKNLLGVESYLGDIYNIAYVKEKVLTDNNLLSGLNEIVHPAVTRHFENWLLNYKEVPYIIKEAAIMNKGRGQEKIIYVTAKEQVRLERILARDTERSPEEIKLIMAKQKTEEEFLAIADFVIYNNDEGLIPQVLKIHQEILSQLIS
jgi:dephospho-CoA kinase